MQWLNYHHLLYFWTVAKSGSIVKASEELHVSQPTISGQIKELEAVLGERLFNRVGRGLVLTEMGHLVYGYADEIFSLGRQLMDTVKQRPTGRPMRLAVGITEGVPKLVAESIMEPVMGMKDPVRLVCREDDLDSLLHELSAFRLDVVLSDRPLGSGTKVKGHTHPLGHCAVAFFGAKKIAAQYAKNFPQSLDNAPVFVPTEDNALRRSLELWWDQQGIRPQILGEFEDGALMKVFASRGTALFPAPAVIAAPVCQQYGVQQVGTIDAVQERFYAITVDRKIKHPAVLALCDTARHKLFS